MVEGRAEGAWAGILRAGADSNGLLINHCGCSHEALDEIRTFGVLGARIHNVSAAPDDCIVLC